MAGVMPVPSAMRRHEPDGIARSLRHRCRTVQIKLENSGGRCLPPIPQTDDAGARSPNYHVKIESARTLHMDASTRGKFFLTQQLLPGLINGAIAWAIHAGDSVIGLWDRGAYVQ